MNLHLKSAQQVGVVDEAVATAWCVTDVLFQAEAKEQWCCFVHAYTRSRMCSAVPEVLLHVLQTEQADNSSWVAHIKCSQDAQVAS